MDRRTFVKAVGAAGGCFLSMGKLRAEEAASCEFCGILVDTTRCIGCRKCELACAEFQNLPEPDLGAEAIERERETTATQLTVVNNHQTEAGYAFLKRQCMHCNQPACAAACLTRAMLKTREGPVIWREDQCMGCRACMLSCPFDVPKFEYHSAIPKIAKCDLCRERLQNGQQPACVDACPAGALLFGKRRDLL